jgi:hypothetical protein
MLVYSRMVSSTKKTKNPDASPLIAPGQSGQRGITVTRNVKHMSRIHLMEANRWPLCVAARWAGSYQQHERHARFRQYA